MRTSKTSPLQILSALAPAGKSYLRLFWFVLIVFAVLYGILLARLAAPYQRVGLDSQWGHAVWIAPQTDNAVSYYRREWTIDFAPGHAYLQVQAPDSFTVYVNGIAVGGFEKISTAAYDIFDVGSYLVAGRNTVAIRVERRTFPGAAALLATLRWSGHDSLYQALSSDDQWRVSLRGESQSGGELAWYDPEFDDSEWPRASRRDGRGIPAAGPAHPWASPGLFQVFPRGAWISNNHTTTGGISFLRQIKLTDTRGGGIRSAWLGVSSTAPYTLIINGARGPSMGNSKQYMDTYNIGAFLVPGSNTIEINTSNLDGVERLMVAGMVDTPHELVDFSSDENWRVRDAGTDWRAASIVGGLTSYPHTDELTGQVFHRPIVRLLEITLPGGLLLRKLIEALPWIAGAFLVTLSLIVLRLSRSGLPSRAIISACMLPWILADVALSAAFLLPFDIRITELHVFNLPVALSIATLSGALFYLIMREAEHGQG